MRRSASSAARTAPSALPPIGVCPRTWSEQHSTDAVASAKLACLAKPGRFSRGRVSHGRPRYHGGPARGTEPKSRLAPCVFSFDATVESLRPLLGAHSFRDSATSLVCALVSFIRRRHVFDMPAIAKLHAASNGSPTTFARWGDDGGAIVVGKILDKDAYAYGYDAQSGEYGNLISKGIIDPTKVVRAALQGAASVAGLLITTEAMVAEVPKGHAPAIPRGPGGGMGGMDF